MTEIAVPRFSRRTAALITVAGLTAAGVVAGALWSWLAPPVHGVIALSRTGAKVKGYLGSEADNFFTSAFILIGLLVVVAVVAAVWLWQWRAHRGPVLVSALAVGCAAAAAAAAGVGAALVHWRYGSIDIEGAPVTPQNRTHYVTEAPAVFFGHTPLQIATTILFPAAIAALVYALIAVSTARDDLGAWPPEQPDPILTGRTGTADDVLPVGPPSPSR